MKNPAIPISLAMVAALAACGNMQSTQIVGPVDAVYVASTGSAIPLGTPARSGRGTIEALRNTAGPSANQSSQLVTMRMDDGSGLQSFVIEGVQLALHERIRIGANGTIHRNLPQ